MDILKGLECGRGSQWGCGHTVLREDPTWPDEIGSVNQREGGGKATCAEETFTPTAGGRSSRGLPGTRTHALTFAEEVLKEPSRVVLRVLQVDVGSPPGSRSVVRGLFAPNPPPKKGQLSFTKTLGC